MQLIKTCLLVLLFIPFAKAQNLIPDSSFERNKYIPTEFSAINSSYYWNMPTQGTTDLFCDCEKKQKKISLVGVPDNPMGSQSPHSGTCYAGMFAFSHGDYREYLQTPLVKPLEKGKTYAFSIHISLADYSRASIDQLGVCFLLSKVSYKSTNVITDLKPVYLKINKVGVTDWHHITVTYKANGRESYLLLGSFKVNKVTKTRNKAPKEIKTRINQKTERDAYYFIDDVSLVETSAVEETKDIIKTEFDTLSKIPHDTSFVLKNVLFETNKAVLLSSSYLDLDKLVDYLEIHEELKIEIAGHSDNVGDENLNKKLSAERAKAVANYLIKKHIDKLRITTKGFGSTKPLVPNDTPEHMKENRRVEFSFAGN
jgi:OOP family OmpA-OmpF porin